MQLLTLSLCLLLVVAAAVVSARKHKPSGLAPICSSVVPGGCVRYVKGYDITGVTTEVDLAYPQVQSACDCLHECVTRNATCANFVYKYTDGSGHRTCTLYSNFNLPPKVTIAFNKAASVKIGPNFSPQAGGLVPQCTANGINGTDPACVSAGVWLLGADDIIC